jgi:hypothetical protein
MYVQGIGIFVLARRSLHDLMAAFLTHHELTLKTPAYLLWGQKSTAINQNIENIYFSNIRSNMKLKW